MVVDEFIHLKTLKRDPTSGTQIPELGELFKAQNEYQKAYNWACVLDDLNIDIEVIIFGAKENVSGKKSFGNDQEKNTSEADVSMMDHLKRMYAAENNYSDLRLETKDNMSLRAHKFQLAARSPYFRRTIDEAAEREFYGTLKVPEVNGKPLTIILHWVYTGELHENAGKFLEELVDASIKFELTGLLKLLDKKLITICNVDNMFRLHQVAKNNAMPTAIQNIAAFIKE